ncbi:MAG: Rne/Rng family ribonuclease [Acidobacteriota bacterium]
MSKEIIVSSNPGEIWVSIMENGAPYEIFVERGESYSILGNIYKGVVSKVLPGMQSAFINIGLDRDAFLYVEDLDENIEDYEKILGFSEEFDEGISESEVPVQRRMKPNIDDFLKEGQEIIVQVTKEPLPRKGARITSYITLPGRYLVYMPSVEHIGVSRKIEDLAERIRVREIALNLKPERGGFIVRTVAGGVGEKELRDDAEYLVRIWKEILKKSETVTAPSIIHKEKNIVLKVIRDYFNSEFTRILVDSEEKYREIVDFIHKIDPLLAVRVKLHEKKVQLMEEFGLNKEVEKALKSRIWLKSGGYIVINQTEALVAIDVNTGKYTGEKRLEDTVLKTNLEAVREIVRQIRLRDLGGIIIIDFIDMEELQNRERVFSELESELKKDRAKTKLLKISDFGLVELTRKRTKQSLDRILSTSCPYCEGSGRVKSSATVSFEIMREIKKFAETLEGNTIIIRAHPDVASYLDELKKEVLEFEMKKRNVSVIIRSDGNLHMEQFDIMTI